MRSHIDCICLTFLQCAFSNVGSNGLPEKMQSHIGCIFFTFLHCAFSNASSNCLPEKIQSHIGCICMTFLHGVFSNASSNCLYGKMQSYIGCICLTFLHYVLLKCQYCIHSHNYLQYFDSAPFLASVVPCIVLVSNWERRKIANSDEQQMKVKLIFKNNIKYIAMHILSNVCIKTFNF